MPNNRIHYAIKQLGIKETGQAAGTVVLPLSASGTNPSGYWQVPRGVQSSTLSTDYNIEEVLQFGQLEAYELSESLPSIEVSVERVLDGTNPLYLMASDADQTTLLGRNTSYQVDIALTIYEDTQVKATGSHINGLYASGMYLSDITYTMSTDGPFTEALTFVGNDLFVSTAQSGSMASGSFPSGVIAAGGDEDPSANIGNLSGVQRREDFDLGNCTLPSFISAECITSVSISASLGRTERLCLGQKAPDLRTIDLPLEVTTTIEVATKTGITVEADSTIDNLSPEEIVIVLLDGTSFNLGTANKLSNVSESGDTGSDETISYTFTNRGTLTISHPVYP